MAAADQKQVAIRFCISRCGNGRRVMLLAGRMPALPGALLVLNALNIFN